MQLILARFVGEVSDPLPVGRPNGSALSGARCVGQIARFAFVTEREHIAPRAEQCVAAIWRDVERADETRGFHRPWFDLGEIAAVARATAAPASINRRAGACWRLPRNS